MEREAPYACVATATYLIIERVGLFRPPQAVLLAIIGDPAQIWARRRSRQNHGLEMTSIPAVNGACRSFTELRTRSRS